MIVGRRRPARVLLVAGLAVCSAAFQQPVFRSRINLVQVDVVVADRDGHAVRGLTAADFQLFDRKHPQEISAFQEVSREASAGAVMVPLPRPVPQDVAANSNGAADRVVVLVVDDFHIYAGRTDKARQLARQVIDAFGDSSSMAVLFTSGNRSTEFTQDQSRLVEAVSSFKGRQSWRRPHQGVDEQTPPRLSPDGDPLANLGLVDSAADTHLQEFGENMSLYKALEDASKLLAGAQARRKAFVLLSEGIGRDFTGLFGAMAPQNEVPLGGVDYAHGDLEGQAAARQPTGYHALAVLAMMESMRRGNVATYAIDPRGSVAVGDLPHECVPPPRELSDDPCADGLTQWNSPVRQAQHGLELIAAASGGFAITNSDDFDGGLRRLVEDIDHYYLLGFNPSDPKGKGFRALDVRVTGHPDWTLRFRRGYEAGEQVTAAKNADPLIALASDVVPRDDLDLRLAATPMPGTGKTARVVLTMAVTEPTGAIRDPDGRFRDVLDYDVLVVDAKKARVTSMGNRQGRLTLSAAHPGTAPPATVTYQIADSIDVPPGRYQMRVSAASSKLARGGSVYLDVDVPDFTSVNAPPTGLVIGFADGPRVPVAPSGPARPALLPFAPTLERVFSSGDTLRVYFEIPRGGDGAMLQLRDAADEPVRSITPPAGAVADVTLSLAGLPAGPYALRASTRSAVREVAIAIR